MLETLDFSKLDREVSKTATKIKSTIAGISHSGKTYTALQLAFGMTGNWEKIIGIDVGERNGINLYSDLGKFRVLKLPSPYTPEKLQSAVQYCVEKGYEAIVIDSLTGIYSGEGGMLDIVNGMNPKDSPWNKVTPRLKKLMSCILNADTHIFCTLRQKSDKVQEQDENTGKKYVKKIGMKDDFKPDSDYDFDLVLEMNREHKAFYHKDRTRLLPDNQWFEIGAQHGQKIAKWCAEGVKPEDEYFLTIDTYEIVEGNIVDRTTFDLANQKPTLWNSQKKLWYSKQDTITKKRKWVKPESPEADLPSNHPSYQNKTNGYKKEEIKKEEDLF